MKKIITASLVAGVLLSSNAAYSNGGPSEASAASIVVTGSVVLLLSTMPLMALDSIFDGRVQNVKSNENKTKDIEIKQKDNKTTVIRLPEQSAKDIQPGQKADFIADPNGHTLKIENKPVAYLPGKTADGLIHSQPLK